MNLPLELPMSFVTAAFAALSLFVHDGHHAHEAPPAVPAALQLAAPTEATTGSGEYTFRHLPVQIPAEMAQQLVHAHGGFAHDARSAGGDGSTYFALKGVGLLNLRADVSAVDVIGGDESFANVNVHNTCLFRAHGETFLALPSDEAQRAFLTSPRGQLLRTFPNPYGDSGQAFRVTDLEYVDEQLIATNGYADNVVFVTNPLRREADEPSLGHWDDHTFGGTGTEHGKFGTAHGITRMPGTNVVTIADRAHARLESFTPDGRYVGGTTLPPGTLPCDVDYLDDLTLVGCLRGPDGSTPAPIYILEHGNIVAELNITRDLGLEGFTHIHNAAFHVVDQPDGPRKLYVLAYAWNPGNFTVLEQVLDAPR